MEMNKYEFHRKKIYIFFQCAVCRSFPFFFFCTSMAFMSFVSSVVYVRQRKIAFRLLLLLVCILLT